MCQAHFLTCTLLNKRVFSKHRLYSDVRDIKWAHDNLSLPLLDRDGSTVSAVSLSWYNKYHELGGLNNRQLCLPLLEAVKSKIKMLAHSVPGEDPLLICRQMPSCCTLTRHRYRYNASHVSTYKGTNPMQEGSILQTELLPEVPTSKNLWRLGLQFMNLVGGHSTFSALHGLNWMWPRARMCASDVKHCG